MFTETPPVTIFKLLDQLNNRTFTGHDAIKMVNGFIKKNEDYKDLIFGILDKNIEIRANNSGHFYYTNTKKIGEAVNYLTLLGDKKDDHAGIKFFVNNNDFVKKGDILFRLFGNIKNNLLFSEKMTNHTYKII